MSGFFQTDNTNPSVTPPGIPANILATVTADRARETSSAAAIEENREGKSGLEVDENVSIATPPEVVDSEVDSLISDDDNDDSNESHNDQYKEYEESLASGEESGDELGLNNNLSLEVNEDDPRSSSWGIGFNTPKSIVDYFKQSFRELFNELACVVAKQVWKENKAIKTREDVAKDFKSNFR